MATATTPTSYTAPSGVAGSMNNAVAEYWEKTALQTRVPNLVMDQAINRGGAHCWKRIPVREGDLIHWWRMPLLATKTTALAETAADGSGQNISAAEVTAQAAQYGDYVMLSDRIDAVMLADPREAFGKALMFQALRTADALIRIALQAGGTARYKEGTTRNTTATALTTVASTDTLTRTILESVSLYFKLNYVPPADDGYWSYFAHPVTIDDLRADVATGSLLDVTKARDQADDSDLYSCGQNYVGHASGFKIFETPEISSGADGGSSATVYRNLATGYEAIMGVHLGGDYTPPPPKVGTGAQKALPQQYRGYNVKLIYKSPSEGGVANPLERRCSLGWKFDTVYKVCEAERVQVHYIGG